MTDAMTAAAATLPAQTAPREYPQALRGPRHRWWRPLLGLATVVAGLVLVTGAILLYALALVIANELGLQAPDPASVADVWFVSPVGLLVTNLGLALCIPLALLATWAQSGRGGLVSSVVGRVRWRLLLGGAGISLAVLVPVFIVSHVLLAELGPGDLTGSGGDESGLWPFTPASAWIALTLVVLLTTPLQAAGEEYLFRGWMTQWLGSWLRWRWIAVIGPAVVTAILFAMAHGAQSPWLFADRLVFGLVASVLVWRTGGLECAIALHTANNLLAFGLAILYDTLEESLFITEVPAVEGAVSIGGTLVATVVLLWWARRQKPVRVVTDPVRPVVTAPVVPGPRAAHPAPPAVVSTPSVTAPAGPAVDGGPGAAEGPVPAAGAAVAAAGVEAGEETAGPKAAEPGEGDPVRDGTA